VTKSARYLFPTATISVGYLSSPLLISHRLFSFGAAASFARTALKTFQLPALPSINPNTESPENQKRFPFTVWAADF
jgi:hypothetical protein